MSSQLEIPSMPTTFQDPEQLSPRFDIALAELTKSYKRKCAELALCTQRIAELESEIKEFKPVKIIQNFESKLKEKQNIIEVLEKRISFLQKKSLGTQNTEKKSSSSQGLDTPISSDSLSADQTNTIYPISKSEGTICTSPKSREDLCAPTHGPKPFVNRTAIVQHSVGNTSLIESRSETSETTCKISQPTEGISGSNKTADTTETEVRIAKSKGRKKNLAQKKPSESLSSPTPFQPPSTDSVIKRGRKRKSVVPAPLTPSFCSDSESSLQHEISSNPDVDLKGCVTALNEKSLVDSGEVYTEYLSAVAGPKLELATYTLSDNDIIVNHDKDHEHNHQVVVAGSEPVLSQKSVENETICTATGKEKYQEVLKKLSLDVNYSTSQVSLLEKESKNMQETSTKSLATVTSNSNETQKMEIPDSQLLNSVQFPESVNVTLGSTKTPDSMTQAEPITLTKQHGSSSRFTMGKKIDHEMFRVVCLKTVSGKILEYYMNKADEYVYKKVSDGVIGKKVGHITEFGKFDANGHLVLNS